MKSFSFFLFLAAALSCFNFSSPTQPEVADNHASPDWTVISTAGGGYAVIDDGNNDCVRYYNIDPNGGPFGGWSITYEQSGDC